MSIIKNLKYLAGTAIVGLGGLANYAKAENIPLTYEFDTYVKQDLEGKTTEMKTPILSSNWMTFIAGGDLCVGRMDNDQGYILSDTGTVKSPSLKLEQLVYQEEDKIYHVNLQNFYDDMQLRAAMEPPETSMTTYLKEVYFNHRKNHFTNLNFPLEQPVFNGEDIIFIANEGDNKNIYRYSVPRRRFYPVHSSEKDKKHLVANNRFIAWAEENNNPESDPLLLSGGGDYDLYVFDLVEGNKWDEDIDPNSTIGAVAISSSGGGQIAYLKNYPGDPEKNRLENTQLKIYFPFKGTYRSSSKVVGRGASIDVNSTPEGRVYLAAGFDYYDLNQNLRGQTIQFLDIKPEEQNSNSIFLDSEADIEVRKNWWNTPGNDKIMNGLTDPKVYLQTNTRFPIISYAKREIQEGIYQNPKMIIKYPKPLIDTEAYLQSFVENYAREGNELPSDVTGDGKVGEQDYKLMFGE